MLAPRPTPLVHLELHTGDLVRARSFYAELCGWRPERIASRHGSYQSLGLGAQLGGLMGWLSNPELVKRVRRLYEKVWGMSA